MQNRLEKLFWGGFALLWGWIVLNSVFRWEHNGPAAFAVGAALAAGVLGMLTRALGVKEDDGLKGLRIRKDEPSA